MQHIIDFIIFPIIALISLCFRPFLKKKHIWIIAENENEACDNGYAFFKYIRINRKDINAYYVIKKKSKEYEKVSKLGEVIKYRSLKHWIYYLNAEKIIVTQKYANPSWALFYLLHVKGILKMPRIFLQHGLIKDDAKFVYYDRTNFRIFICGAKREYEYIKEKFGYPEENLVYSGLARYDGLDYENKIKRDTILVCPTWRKWINTQSEFENLIQKYIDVLNDDEIIKNAKEKKIKIQIVLHKNMSKFKLEKFRNYDYIKINHNNEVEIQKLINKAALFITDHSSMFFDLAYIKTPMIFYKFDSDDYRKNQLQEGYFSYEKDGFGDVIDNKDDMIKKVNYYLNNNFKIESKYEKRMNDFFERKDKNNCKRILDKIEEI